jgi:mannose-6-phosphate isomerase-like protein (cupin superfamily)
MKPTTAVIKTVGRLDASRPRKLGRDPGEVVDIGSTRVRFLVRGPESRGGFSLVEYPITPRTLVAPMHRHTWEDEYSFVLEGRIAALLGDKVVYAEAGELLFKPRRLWHTVWNPDDTPCRILEIISPGGFERFFEELASALQRPAKPEARRDELGARYGVESDFESVPRLCAEHGLVHPLLP